jgi:hypothetical protein
MKTEKEGVETREIEGQRQGDRGTKTVGQGCRDRETGGQGTEMGGKGREKGGQRQ